MAGHRRAEATPFFERLCPAMTVFLNSTTLFAIRRAATAHLRLPGTVLALHDIEGLDGIAVLVEADWSAEPGKPRELRHIVTDLGAVGFEIFRLAGDAGFFDRLDIDAADLVDIRIIHARLDLRRKP